MTTTRRQAIGYTRVSTPGQATKLQGLAHQQARIRETAEKLGLALLNIYEDVGTAAGRFSDVRRGDLQAVLKLAKAQDMPIIVSDLTRLTREPAWVDDVLLLDGVQIVSAKMDETISPAAMRKVVERGQRTIRNISKGTAEGHARRKARGEVSGHVETLEIARENSLVTRKNRAVETVDLVATVLESNPAYQKKTAAEMAEVLNDLGILSGWRRPFNTETVRRVIRAAKQEIQNRRLADQDDEDEVLVTSPATSQPASAKTKDLDPDDLADLNRALGLPVDDAPAAGLVKSIKELERVENADVAQDNRADEIDLLEELDDLDLTLGREEVYAPATRIAAKSVVGARSDDDDIADLDRALGAEEAYIKAEEAYIKAQAASRTVAKPKVSRKSVPAAGKIPIAPAAPRPTLTTNVQDVAPTAPSRSKPPVTEEAPPAAEEPHKEAEPHPYADNPDYGRF